MTQRVMHTCPNCGRRFKCNVEAQSEPEQPGTRVYDLLAHNESHIELTPSRAYPTLRYEVYWGISQMVNAMWKTLAFWLALNAPMWGLWGVSEHYDIYIPAFFPFAASLISFGMFLRMFGKVPEWHNHVEQEPPTPLVEAEPQDERQFAGWPLKVTSQTRSSMQLKALEDQYIPPCPIDEAMSYALALVNQHWEWIDERHRKKRGAKISGGNYRKLRLDWLERKWCYEYGNKTIVTKDGKQMILEIAFSRPE